MLSNEIITDSISNSKNMVWDEIKDTTPKSYREWWLENDYENNYILLKERIKNYRKYDNNIHIIRNDIRFLYNNVDNKELKEKLDLLIDLADDIE